MKTIEFCKKHGACKEGEKWAVSISDDMAVVWDALIAHRKIEWLCWTAGRDDVLSERELRLLACKFVRETPLADGLKVWDLLTDERSRNAVVIAERFAMGEANADELDAAWSAARYAAMDAASAAAMDAARYAARYAAMDAASAAAMDAASAAAMDAASAAAMDAAIEYQCDLFKSFPNPFSK